MRSSIAHLRYGLWPLAYGNRRRQLCAICRLLAHANLVRLPLLSRFSCVGTHCSMRAPSRAATTPAVPATSSAYLWWSMTSIVLGRYISVLTNHVMNMVLPKTMSDLGTAVVTIRWVVTSYMIANAVVMPLAGWIARTLGARDLLI